MPIKTRKIFFLPSLELKHFLFLYFFLISLLKKIVQTFFNKKKSIDWDFLALYMYDVGDLLSIIPYIIMKIRLKTVKKNNNNVNNKVNNNFSRNNSKDIINNIDNNVLNDDSNNNLRINNSNSPITMLYYQQEKKNKCSIILRIFVFTIVDFIAQISKVVFYVVIEKKNIKVELDDLNSTLIFFIISTILFSKIMLHYEFGRHHYFSFFIDLFCLIILSILDIIEICDNNNTNRASAIIYLVIKIIKDIFYSFSDVLLKVIFLYDFISPYTMLLIKAIIQFFYLVIFSLPFIFDNKFKKIFSRIADNFAGTEFVMIAIGFTINSFFYNILLSQIINVFSPNHFLVAKVFENFGVFIISFIIKGKEDSKIEDYEIAIKIIMFILLIFASVIFNEYLVINICGLAKKTKLFLNYEALNEIDNKKSDESSYESVDSNSMPLIKESDMY